MNSHSNTNWNQKVNKSLHRSDFKEFFFMLDSNLKDNRFIKQFDDLKVVFNCLVQYSDLGKILKPSDDELAESFNSNNESCNTRIENRLLCNICHFYKNLGKVNGHAPECRPFDCYNYYHGDFRED